MRVMLGSSSTYGKYLQVDNSLLVQKVNKAPGPRIVAFRKDGSALDTVTVMIMMS